MGFLLVAAMAVSASDAADSDSQLNSLGMKMVLIRPDQFLTGTHLDRYNWQWYERNEIPRWVNLTAPFRIATHEVTNAQYRRFVQETEYAEPRGLLLRGPTLVRDFQPWKDPAFKDDDQPVVCVTYADAEAFCRWLSAKEKKNYRLPTSDEWEYACRAGRGADYNWGSDHITPEMANYDPFLVESASVEEGARMMSLQQAARLRGGKVELSEDKRECRATILGRQFVLTPGSREARVDGRTVTMGVPCTLRDDTVMVPLRFLAFDVGLIFTGTPKPVGSFRPNDWGLYDMHGNVGEITSTGNNFRVVRGGGWNDSARRCRSASVRDRWKSDCGMAGIGFRVVCDAPSVRRLEVTLGEALIVKPVIDSSLATTGRTILRLRDGTLILQDRMSADGGKTWRGCPMQPNTTALQAADGSILSVPFMIPRDKDKPEGWGKVTCLRSTDGWRTVQPYEATFHVPEAIGGFDDAGTYRDVIGYCDHDMIEMPGGDLLLTLYGFWRSARILSDYQRYPIETQQWKYVGWIMRSSDKGRTWTCMSAGIVHPELTRGGGCELGLIRLTNGHLLMAGRTGEHGYPNERILFVWSKDGGATWIEPSRLLVDNRPVLGIFPQFALMSNGILAMTWGRTGDAATAVAFSLDGTGKTWTDFTPIPDDMGGYNDIAEISPGRLLISSSKKVGEQLDLRLIPVTVRVKP